MDAGGKALRAEANSGHMPLRVGVLWALAVLLATLLCAGAAWAQTFAVTNLKDSGTGSLREAINRANSSAGPDEVTFARGLGGTITLRSTLPTVTDPAGLDIHGGGDVRVNGNYAVGALSVGEGAALSLKGLTVARGRGILNEGTLEVTNTTISNNSAVSGGGIFNGGLLKVTNSTVSSNSAEEGGGGIFNDRGTLEVTDSTVSGNGAYLPPSARGTRR